MIIGILGLKGAGKDTIADYLVENYNYKKDSFAASLKDATAVMFNWDREMLEGNTPESRAEREVPDPYWSEKLNMQWSPRFALQYLGTNVLRKQFYDGIWLSSLEHRLLTNKNDTVISDVRFPNEIKLIKEAGGVLIHVVRGIQPEWHEMAVHANNGSKDALHIMQVKYEDVHESEWAWAGTDADYTIMNNRSFEELFDDVNIVYNGISTRPRLTLV